MSLLFRPLARLEELLERFRVVLKKTGEVSQNLHGVGAQMMFDAFDILLLRVWVEPEQREKTGKRFMALLNAACDSLSLFCQDESAIFFVIEITQFAELLHHAGDRCLLDLERRRDVHNPR